MKLDDYLNLLKAAAEKQTVPANEVSELKSIPYWKNHELAHALMALLCYRAGIACSLPRLESNAKGAVSIFASGCFPWRKLPYPREHAELGAWAYQLGKEMGHDPLLKAARQMRMWQQNITDHCGRPLFSLFMQENGCDFRQLEQAYVRFFETVACETPPENFFLDEELGLVIDRNQRRTVMCVGSGCKSGMGGFFLDGASVVNYGFQRFPLGESESFGLAGLPVDFHCASTAGGFSLSYVCRLAAPHPRPTGISGIKDSGFSGFWACVNQLVEHNRMEFHGHLQGISKQNPYVLTLFGTGASCMVAKSHKLNPNSLDRYQGPAQPFAFHGKEGEEIHISPLDGFSKMEMIPLDGSDHFWKAQFLAVLFPSADSFQIHFTW